MHQQINTGPPEINVQTSSEWIGVRGRIGAWYLNSPLRRLSEIMFLGDLKSAFLNEVSRIIMGDEVVLDVGAGSGYFSLAIAGRLTSGKVICLDLSEEMLHRLVSVADKKWLGDRIQILKGEASSIKLSDGFVDLVVSNGVFHELSEPGSCLKEMIRVLKPGGWLIVTDFRNTRIGKRTGAAHNREAHGPLSVDELGTLFADAGLGNVKVYPVKHWVVGVGKK
ncbi:MAG: class I SAM-dependent methyltransferase [Candidatus Methanoperedens sp.]|nr:class I SAM-dependent methyltransferase [Candidatus Methanoperedens sp.]